MIAASLLLFAYQYYVFSQNSIPIGSTTFDFPFAIHFVKNRLSLALCIIPLGLFCVAIFMFVLPRAVKNTKVVGMGMFQYGIAIILLIIALSLSCLSSIPALFGEFNQMDVKLFGSHKYYIGGSWSLGVGSIKTVGIGLYECDDNGRNCRLIHLVDYFDIEESEFKNMNALLVPDPVTNTIALQINSETVYTHRVE